MGKRGESFGRWYYARGKGQQYLLCLMPVVVASVALVLFVPRPEPQPPEGTIKVSCPPLGDVYLRLDDLILENRDPDTISQLKCMPAAGDPR